MQASANVTILYTPGPLIQNCSDIKSLLFILTGGPQNNKRALNSQGRLGYLDPENVIGLARDPVLDL